MKRLLSTRAGRAWCLQLLWEPRDLWLGIYWTLDGTVYRVYLCLLPCLPIRFSWYNRAAREWFRNTPRYYVTSDRKIVVESKESIRQRMGGEL